MSRECIVIRRRLQGEIFPGFPKHPKKAKIIAALASALAAENALTDAHSRYLDLLERKERAGISSPQTSASDWIAPAELVNRIGGSLTSWARYRSEGHGPLWTKGGPAGILYHWPSVQKWLAEGGTRAPHRRRTA